MGKVFSGQSVFPERAHRIEENVKKVEGETESGDALTSRAISMNFATS